MCTVPSMVLGISGSRARLARGIGALGCSALLLLSSRPVVAQNRVSQNINVDLGGVQLELVLIRAGSFVQGSPATEKDRGSDETERNVTLTHDYYLGRAPITVAQFTRFTEETGYRTEAETGKSGGFGFAGQGLVQRPDFNWKNPGFVQTGEQPVTLVTYGDAQAFNGWVTHKTGRTFDLPSEAEWEYAYRAGTKTRFYTGDAEGAATDLGWFKHNASGGTAPVAKKQPNAFGLYDMGGNVYEWCRDWYGPYAAGPASDPEQSSPPAGDKARRVLRGGSWLKDAKHLRAAARYRNDPGSRNADNGFRVRAALEVTEKAPLTGADSNAATRGAVTPGAGKESHEWWFSALLVGLIGLFGVASVAVLIISLLRRPRPMPGAPGVTYRPEGDGFWVYAPAGLHGSRLHYRARVPGGPQRAVVPLESSASGQFVYTGAKPQSVEAEQVVAFHVGYAMGAAPQQPSPRDEYVEPPQSAFRGYPSAY
jgi:formylglycine-generating enzyme